MCVRGRVRACVQARGIMSGSGLSVTMCAYETRLSARETHYSEGERGGEVGGGWSTENWSTDGTQTFM